jgi:transcriptional regulator with XRE-family HTH domain
MKSADFGAFLKEKREAKGIPQRIVAYRLNIDTSTLSKIELGERQVNIDMIKGLSEILELDFKQLQIRFISDKILSDYAGQPFLKDAISVIMKKLK